MKKHRKIFILSIFGILIFGAIHIWLGIENKDHLAILGAVIFLAFGIMYVWNTKF